MNKLHRMSSAKFSLIFARVSCMLLASLTMICGFSLIKLLGVFFIHLQDAFGASATVISFTLGLPISIVFIGGPLYGTLFNAVGVRLSYTIAGCFLCTGLCSCYWAVHILHVQVFLGIFGVGAGIVNITTLTIAGRCFWKTRPMAMGCLGMAGAVCGAIGTPIVQELIEQFTWKGAMFIMGAYTLHIIPFGICLEQADKIIQNHKKETYSVPKSKKEEQFCNNNKGEDVFIPSNNSFTSQKTLATNGSFVIRSNGTRCASQTEELLTHINQNRRKSFKRRASSVSAQVGNLMDVSLLKDFLFIGYCVMTGITICARLTSVIYIVRFAQSENIDDHSAVVLVTIMDAANFIMCPFICIVTSFKSSKDVQCGERFFCALSCLRRSYVLSIFQFFMSLVLLLPTFYPQKIGFVTYSAALGLCLGGISPLPNIVIIDLFGTSRIAGAMGYRSLATGVSVVTIPVLIGYLIDLYGTYKIAQYATSILCVTACVMTFTIQVLMLRREKLNRRSPSLP